MRTVHVQSVSVRAVPCAPMCLNSRPCASMRAHASFSTTAVKPSLSLTHTLHSSTTTALSSLSCYVTHFKHYIYKYRNVIYRNKTHVCAYFLTLQAIFSFTVTTNDLHLVKLPVLQAVRSKTVSIRPTVRSLYQSSTL